METVKNSYPVIREAKVINTTDPEKLGRIQLKVYPELAEIADSDCPWAFPHTSGIHGKSFGVPLIGQLISCVVFNRYWNEITFLPFNITKPEEHIFDKWIDKQCSKIKDIEVDPEEEHLIVEQYEDDFSVFHDTKNNQHGFLHSTGTYVMIDKEGTVYIESVKNLMLHNDDDSVLISVDSKSGNIGLETKGNVNEIVEKDVNWNIKGNIKDTINENVDTDIKKNWTVKIGGDFKVSVDGDAEFVSTRSGKLKIGNAIDTLGAMGKAVLEGLMSLHVEGSPTAQTAAVWAAQTITPIMVKWNNVFN
jgi:hypothetical protein